MDKFAQFFTIHDYLVIVEAQYVDASEQPDFYDVFDNNGTCLNEGNPFYTMPTEGQLEVFLANEGLISHINLKEGESSSLLKSMPVDKVIELTFGSSVKMIAPFEPEAIRLLMKMRAAPDAPSAQ